MSLLRLLTAGKSLEGLHGSESPYRLSSQRLLPQFGPARNPFSNRAKTEPAQTEARSPETPGESVAPAAKTGSLGPSREPAAGLRKRVEHRAALAMSGARNLAAALWRRLAVLLSGWQAKLRGLFTRSGGKAAKSAIPRFPKPPVQGELSLDRIKVVRNDLSDADLEIVLARTPAASAATAPTLRTVEKTEGAQSAWGRVTSRFLGAGKT
jgi:hypothetical protein